MQIQSGLEKLRNSGITVDSGSRYKAQPNVTGKQGHNNLNSKRQKQTPPGCPILKKSSQATVTWIGLSDLSYYLPVKPCYNSSSHRHKIILICTLKISNISYLKSRVSKCRCLYVQGLPKCICLNVRSLPKKRS